MGSWTYPTTLLQTCLAVTLCGLTLAGCGRKTEVTTEPSKSQVIAKLGNQVVTEQELDNEFRLSNVPVEQRKDPQIIRRVLGELVTRKFMVQQAIDAKLDRQPLVLLDILRAREIVLADALVTQEVNRKSEAISKGDIDNYIANNPQKFAQRQLMSVEQISFPLGATTQAVIDATKEMKTLDEVDQKLTAMGVPHSRSAGSVSTGDLPQDLMGLVAARKPDDIFFIRAGANGLFFKVTGEQSSPLQGGEATNAARQYLRRDIVKLDLGMTSVSANLEAKYEDDYSAIMHTGPDGKKPGGD